jgi:hypothetical protein
MGRLQKVLVGAGRQKFKGIDCNTLVPLEEAISSGFENFPLVLSIKSCSSWPIAILMLEILLLAKQVGLWGMFVGPIAQLFGMIRHYK